MPFEETLLEMLFIYVLMDYEGLYCTEDANEL